MEIFKHCEGTFKALVNIQCLVPVLSSKDWLTIEQSQQMELPSSTEERKKEILLRILPTKDMDFLPKFIGMLRAETQHIGHKALADILDEKYNNMETWV